MRVVGSAAAFALRFRGSQVRCMLAVSRSAGFGEGGGDRSPAAMWVPLIVASGSCTGAFVVLGRSTVCVVDRPRAFAPRLNGSQVRCIPAASPSAGPGDGGGDRSPVATSAPSIATSGSRTTRSSHPAPVSEDTMRVPTRRPQDLSHGDHQASAASGCSSVPPGLDRLSAVRRCSEGGALSGRTEVRARARRPRRTGLPPSAGLEDISLRQVLRPGSKSGCSTAWRPDDTSPVGRARRHRFETGFRARARRPLPTAHCANPAPRRTVVGRRPTPGRLPPPPCDAPPRRRSPRTRTSRQALAANPRH